MNLRRSLSRISGFIAAMTLCFSSTTASAGIPVIDAASLAQQIQQVLAWAQQYQQMAQQYQQMVQQLQQLKTTYQSMSGARGLGAIAQNPAILSVLPTEIQDPLQMLVNPSATGTTLTNLNQIRSSFGINSTTDPSAGLSNAETIGRLNKILTSAKYRASQLQTLSNRVDTAADSKESLDLINRNVLEAASISNQAIQTAASMEAARQAEALRLLAARQTFNDGLKSGASAPLLTFAK